MQWKIARPSRLSDRFNRWAIRRGFPALAWLAPRAPRWFLLAGARRIIGVVMFLHPKPKADISRNLARITGLRPGSRALHRAVREMLHHLAYYWVDLFRFAQLPAERLLELVEGRGTATIEPLRAAHAAGERVILLTAHLGNWELGAILVGQADLPVSVVYVPDEFGEAEHYRSVLRSFGRLEEIPIRVEDRFASLPVLRAFANGRLVALQGDRDFNDRGIELPFFGQPARFPAGPFHLARMTEARLWPSFIAYTPERGFEIELGTPIEVERTADRDGDVRRAAERWVAVLEAAVARWPTQWYTFYDFWASDGASTPSGPAVPPAGDGEAA